jgi:hypothetical protein
LKNSDKNPMSHSIGFQQPREARYRVSFSQSLISFSYKIKELILMLLQLKDNGEMVKINNIQELIDPNQDVVHAQEQEGQEEQQTDSYKKDNLVFPSGENLPRCWIDANYRNAKA